MEKLCHNFVALTQWIIFIYFFFFFQKCIVQLSILCLGNGRKCVWPPQKPEDEYRSGRSTPQSPQTGRRIVWNPSPSPPTNRRVISPARRKDIQWPPPSPTAMGNEKEILIRGSPRLSRKGRFEDYIREHASINVPQTYRPPPGTQHVEYR